MFGRRFPLFRILGFKVNADPSWLIIAALVTWSLSAGLFPLLYPGLSPSAYWLMGLAGAAGLFFSILFHELSHAVVGRRYGMEVEGITLWIFGGVAEMTHDADEPGHEFLMAGAGPLASFFLAVAFYGVALALALGGVSITVVGVFGYLAWLNLILGVFNLVPAFPLDGGRILRAALWKRRDDIVSATRTSAKFGNAFGWILIALGGLAFITGNVVGGIWWILIGAFIRFAAKASFRHFLAQRLLSEAPVRRIMDPHPVQIDPHMSISRFVQDYVLTKGEYIFPVGRGGQITGIVDLEAVQRIPRAEWDFRTVGEITQALTHENAIDPEDDAAKALQQLQKSGRRSLLVTHDGDLEGVLSIDDLERYLTRRATFDGEQGPRPQA
jgi:Zn-dependent protease